MNISPRLTGSTTSEPPSTPPIGTGGSSDTPPNATGDTPLSAFNMDGDAIPMNESLGQCGVGVVGGRNPGTLPSEVIDPVPQASVDLSQRLNVLELTDAPNSIDNTDPDDQQTEAQKGAEEQPAAQPRDDDISHLITSVSKEPIYTRRRFGNGFTGIHNVVGKVALKRIRVGDTRTEEEAFREANAWRFRLQHNYVLEFLGTSKVGKHLCLVNRFIENGNLLDYIDRHPDVNRIRLLCEASEGLDYLHRENIVHGNIKARNILVGADTHVLICDFGLTDLEFAESSLPCQRGRWQSPELWDGPGRSIRTFASDVYAFSMTIAEVLTGKPPFLHISLDPAVVIAVYSRNERPEKAPMGSNGVSYETAWQVAELCWPTLPEDRIPMSEASRLLKEDPSLT